MDPLPVPAQLLSTDSVYRTMGGSRESGLIGIGVIDKSGRSADATSTQPDHYSALYVLRGSGEYHDDTGFRATFRQGSLIQRFTDRRHTTRLEPASGFIECFIAVNRSLATALMTMGVIDRRRPVLDPGIDATMVHELLALRRRLHASSEPELPLLAGEVLRALLDLLTRDLRVDAADPHAELVSDACRALTSDLDERSVIAAIVGRSGLSYERFRKVFRARMGVSPGEYRIRRRIDRARELLNADDLPIKDIAERLGYANPFVFSAQFRERVGVPPEVYRRRGR
jgi:AraC-like DNA-binding protein